jgi:hypothetical protein
MNRILNLTRVRIQYMGALKPLLSCFARKEVFSTNCGKDIRGTTQQDLRSLMNYKHSRNTWKLIQEQLRTTDKNNTIVVLDDDPTGCQTLYDINVLIDYSKESLKQQLQLNHKLFYILINSRSMPPVEAESINNTVLNNLFLTMKEIHYSNSVTLVSRSDSTLRGHFPLETDTIRNFLATHQKEYPENIPPVNGIVLCPTFFEGGRYTLNDIHYFQNDQKTLVPVGETDFAKDAHFSYRSSDLKEWIVEKSQGTISWQEILSISLEDIRVRGDEFIKEQLLSRKDFIYIVVNGKIVILVVSFILKKFNILLFFFVCCPPQLRLKMI